MGDSQVTEKTLAYFYPLHEYEQVKILENVLIAAALESLLSNLMIFSRSIPKDNYAGDNVRKSL